MASIAEQNALTTTIKAWPERVKTFYNDVRTEMKKVTTPSFKDVQATTGGRHHYSVSVWSVFLGRGQHHRQRHQLSV